jgi:hypothetical protein
MDPTGIQSDSWSKFRDKWPSLWRQLCKFKLYLKRDWWHRTYARYSCCSFKILPLVLRVSWYYILLFVSHDISSCSMWLMFFLLFSHLKIFISCSVSHDITSWSVCLKLLPIALCLTILPLSLCLMMSSLALSHDVTSCSVCLKMLPFSLCVSRYCLDLCVSWSYFLICVSIILPLPRCLNMLHLALCVSRSYLLLSVCHVITSCSVSWCYLLLSVAHNVTSRCVNRSSTCLFLSSSLFFPSVIFAFFV